MTTAGRPKGLVASVDETGTPVGYSIEKFYLGSRDTKGHSASRNLQIRFPANIEGLLEKVVQDPRTPYTTIHDLARDGVLHRAMWIAETFLKDRDLAKGVSAQYVLEEMDRVSARRAKHNEYVQKLRRTLSTCDSVEMYQQIKWAELYRDGLEDIEDIAEVNDVIQRYKR